MKYDSSLFGGTDFQNRRTDIFVKEGVICSHPLWNHSSHLVSIFKLPVIWLAANAKGLISCQTGLISKNINYKVA